MGKSTVPAAPDIQHRVGGGRACPDCGHAEPFAAPEPSLLALLRRAPWTCGYFEVEQDALSDTIERCKCRNLAHGS